MKIIEDGEKFFDLMLESSTSINKGLIIANDCFIFLEKSDTIVLDLRRILTITTPPFSKHYNESLQNLKLCKLSILRELYFTRDEYLLNDLMLLQKLFIKDHIEVSQLLISTNPYIREISKQRYGKHI